MPFHLNHRHFTSILAGMSKSHFYHSECAKVAEKSPMCFKLGAIIVKGGKVISSGYNHHRPHYDGAEVRTHGHRKPVSMHAEMHAIFSLTGMSPSFRKQVQGVERRVPQRLTGGQVYPPPSTPDPRPPIPKGSAAPEGCLSGAPRYEELVQAQDTEEEVEGPWSELERQQQRGLERKRQRTRTRAIGAGGCCI